MPTVAVHTEISTIVANIAGVTVLIFCYVFGVWLRNYIYPTDSTTPLKRQLMLAYGYGGLPLTDFELDHLISLELGGSPRDPANLWPEPWTGPANARQKDVVENYLHQQVCTGALSLADAQRAIATNWPAVPH